MKLVKIKSKIVKEESIGYLLNSEDLNYLAKYLDHSIMNIIKKFVNSNEPPNRFDHVVGGLTFIEKGIAILAVSYDNIHQTGNPIYQLPKIKENYLKTVLRNFAKSNQLFINKNGGVQDLELLEVIETIEENVKFKDSKISKIRNNSKILNLENDPELEPTAIQYMKAFSKSKLYSYITELSLHSEYELKTLFTDFKNKGGEFIYVYTTGRNVDQMYMYSKIALQCGLNKFIFNFNCGVDNSIDKFISWLEPKSFIVDYNTSLNLH